MIWFSREAPDSTYIFHDNDNAEFHETPEASNILMLSVLLAEKANKETFELLVNWDDPHAMSL